MSWSGDSLPHWSTHPVYRSFRAATKIGKGPMVFDAEPGHADYAAIAEKMAADVPALAARFARGDAVLQADLDQEGRLALLRAEQTFRPSWKAGFRTYAQAGVRNAMLNYVKGERRWALQWISLDDETVAAVLDQQALDRWHGGGSFWQRMAGLEQREDIEKCNLRRVLAVLTEAEWRVFKRSVVDERSYADIAAELGKTVAAVKQLRYRAWRKIEAERQRLLEGEGHEEE